MSGIFPDMSGGEIVQVQFQSCAHTIDAEGRSLQIPVSSCCKALQCYSGDCQQEIFSLPR